MPDRRPVPLLILSILAVLTAGAIATGLLLAPASADLAVQNAAGENLLAPSMTVHIVVNESAQQGSRHETIPPNVQTFVVHPTEPIDKSTQQGQQTAGIVMILRAVSTGNPWIADPNSYRYNGSIAQLLGLNQRAQQAGIPVKIKASGLVRSWVRGGYLAALHVNLVVHEGSIVVRATEIFTFTDIAGYHPDVSHLAS